ncbi:prolyl oligopeptidase family serine peptidase [candidate division GN15 bacterium]|nr:prolyl oligopeptidase family serine peptidase [candidate division GN15 bacterium]
MTEPTGTIVAREEVSLSKVFEQTVKRMYPAEILERNIVERITYISDGLRITGYIARPKAKGRYPVIIWNRGGHRDRGALDDLTSWLILGSTADWGYVLLGTQYRGNKGSEGDEDWGGKDVDDALNMIAVAEHLDQCDMDRMAIEGASRGGMTTYRALARESRFACGIVHAGISDIEAIRDFSESFRSYTDRKFQDLSDEERESRITEMSAVRFADKLPKTTPLLLMHGTEDDTVPFSQTEKLVTQLDTHGVPYRFEPIEGGGHVALKDGSYKRIDELRRAWLEEHLG